MFASWPIHPLLLACYPVVYLLAENKGEVYVSDAAASLVAVVLGASVLLVVARWLLGDWARGGLVSSLALGICFLHAGLLELWDRVSGVGAGSLGVLEGALLLGGIFLFRRRPRDPVFATGVLNVVLLVLVAIPTFSVARQVLEVGEGFVFRPAVVDPAGDTGLEFSLNSEREDLPDIYYILVDGYARADVLRDLFGHDNSEFLAALRALGFYVAERSASNHTSTFLGLATVLGLDYLEALDPAVKGRANRMARSQELGSDTAQRIKRSRVVAALRTAGYQIISIPTGRDRYVPDGADEYVTLASAERSLGEFERAILDMTPFPALVSTLPGENESESQTQRRRILYAIEQLGEMPSRSGPSFVFAHLMAPHPPFVFGPEGQERQLSHQLFHDYSDPQIRAFAGAYADQVEFLNGRLLEVVSKLVEESAISPIIILQGDHGLRLFQDKGPDTICLVESFAILNALRLPGVPADRLYETISPVNTFRLIFDGYFGTSLGLLEDRSYFANRFGMFVFRDVSDRVETCSGVEITPGGVARRVDR
jgi:hypothetical protein